MCFDHLCGLVIWPAGECASGLFVQGRVSSLTCISLKLYLPRTASSSGGTRLEDVDSSSRVGHLLGYPLGDLPSLFPYHSFSGGWSYVLMDYSLSSFCPLFLFIQAGSWWLHLRASGVMCLLYPIVAPCFLVCPLCISQFVTAHCLFGWCLLFCWVEQNCLFLFTVFIAVDTIPSMSHWSVDFVGGVLLVYGCNLALRKWWNLEFETSLGYRAKSCFRT